MKKIQLDKILIVILIILLILRNIKYPSSTNYDDTILLKNKINYLENELNTLGFYNNKIYNYSLTRLLYRETYSDNVIYIINKDKYQKGNALVNKDGFIGIINDVYDNYSKCTLLTGLDNITVSIKDNYGTIRIYENNLFYVYDLTNEVEIGSPVYTSTYGSIHEKLFIGNVYSTEYINSKYIVKVKSNVDFNNIDYMYVVGDV